MQLLTYIEVNQKVRDALQASISAYERNGGKVATYHWDGPRIAWSGL